MTSYDRRYGAYASLVRSSIAWVMVAGRGGNALEIAMQKCRHHDLMQSVRRKLGL